MKKKTKSFALSAILALGVCGCTQEKPPGPAEQIGRGVDQILGGINRMDQEAQDKAARPSPTPKYGQDGYGRGRYDSDWDVSDEPGDDLYDERSSDRRY